jgi:hypothetical protein
MDSDRQGNQSVHPRRMSRAWRERLRQGDRWVPMAAIAAVAVAAVLAAVMTQRSDFLLDAAPAKLSQLSLSSSAAEPKAGGPVVHAPPLVGQTPPTAVAKTNPTPAATADTATRVLGAAGPTCKTCGVVESVIAVRGESSDRAVTVGYLMQIRMDDGTWRMVEQRGAMPAGSRVVVEGSTVRLSRGQG